MSVDKLTRPFNRHAGQVTTRALRPRIPLRRPMKPPLDLAYRARNWFWYWRVRQISGLSNDRLDAKCFGDSRRRRSFDRLQETASSPDRVPVVDGNKLLQVVDDWRDVGRGSAIAYRQATLDFRSELWDILGSRQSDPAVYTKLINTYAANRGWTRIANSDAALYRAMLGRDEPAVEEGVSTAYSAMLHKIANDATPQSIAVLAALYRETVHQGSLDLAISVQHAIRAAVPWMCDRLGMDARTSMLIQKLVKDRVIANRWFTEEDWKKTLAESPSPGRSTRSRAKDLQAYVDWYVYRSGDYKREEYGRHPIVPRSERLDWISEQRDVLSEAFNEAERSRVDALTLSESISGEIREHSVRLAQRSADLLQSRSVPPLRGQHFYSHGKPVLTIGNLPDPCINFTDITSEANSPDVEGATSQRE